ncbi:hypothetical protein AKO1_002720, partial [Acrasis kona]
MFWPSRYSCKILKRATLSSNKINFDTSTKSDTSNNTPTELLNDENFCNTDAEASTPKTESMMGSELKVVSEREDIQEVAGSSSQPTNDICPHTIEKVVSH